MKNLWSLSKRELASYFATPVAYVFIVIFLLLAGFLTFQVGGFYQREQADLVPFFTWHPWLYLFLVPAVTMRLWAEERKTGTIELLMTLPITLPQAILGKFLAAWLFALVALVLTFPIWITVNALGDPDNGAIAAGYFGSFLMAGGFLAIGSATSAITRNQVIAFVLSVVICFAFLLASFPGFTEFFEGWAPEVISEAIGSFSFSTHFDAISKGVLDLRDLVFFGSVIAFFLFLNALILEAKKAE